MSELKPCPFCGGQPTWWKTKVKHCQLHGDPYQDDILGCRKPRCRVRPYVCETIKEHSIDIWNHRGDGMVPHHVDYKTFEELQTQVRELEASNYAFSLALDNIADCFIYSRTLTDEEFEDFTKHLRKQEKGE